MLPMYKDQKARVYVVLSTQREREIYTSYLSLDIQACSLGMDVDLLGWGERSVWGFEGRRKENEGRILECA